MINLLNTYALLQGQEWIWVVVLVLLLFGGTKIPQLMRGLGKGMGEFQEGMKEGKKKFDEALKDDSSNEETKA
ncbi:MAG: twin-arginine translocase TatA/TatE family subunit [Armatimonadetes bacterium]|nr:twin-arginine translocase TatA/TatE family subunit [Armatimonadota bacterium]